MWLKVAIDFKMRQEARGRRQEAGGKGQEARGRRQGAGGKGQGGVSLPCLLLLAPCLFPFSNYVKICAM